MPFFNAWEFAGKFPDILSDPTVGEAASNLYDDARRMLKQVIAETWLKARAVVGLFPANSVGDDVEIYTDETRTEVAMRVSFLRQQKGKPGPAARVPGRLRCAEVEWRARLLRRVRGDAPGSASRSTWRASRRRMTTIRASC